MKDIKPECGHSGARANGTGEEYMILPDGRVLCPRCATWETVISTSRDKRYRVLWVDDYIEPWLGMVWQWLQDSDIGLVPARDDDEALGFLANKNEHFDLMLQDFQRPPGECMIEEDTANGELTGLAFCRRHVRRVRPDLPCIFVTATPGDSFIIEQIANLNGCSLLGKPLNKGVLIETIMREIDKSRSKDNEDEM